MRIPNVLKKALKLLAIVIATVLVFVSAYVSYNWPIAPKYKKVSDSELHTYLSYLDQTESEPARFIGNQFRHYDIVLIGEAHKRKQDVDFVRSLIPYLYKNNGVSVIGWEFGASELQAEVDSFLSARLYDAKWATSILRRTTWYWNYQEYLDFYRDIWEFNHSLPQNAEKVRFLQMGSIYSERKLQSNDKKVRNREWERYRYDKKMFEIMEREVLLKGKKALWYSGLHHAFTKFHQPIPFFLRSFGEERGGNLLYDKYPDKVYFVALHAPAYGRLFFLLDGFVKNYYPWGAVLDKIYERRHIPFAFDVATSPFAYCEDNYSYYSLDHWGPIRLRDYSDGYVVLYSFRETQPVHSVESWIADAADSAEVFGTLPPERMALIKSVKGLLQLIEQDPVKMMRFQNSVDTTGYAQ